MEKARKIKEKFTQYRQHLNKTYTDSAVFHRRLEHQSWEVRNSQVDTFTQVNMNRMAMPCITTTKCSSCCDTAKH